MSICKNVSYQWQHLNSGWITGCSSLLLPRYIMNVILAVDSGIKVSLTSRIQHDDISESRKAFVKQQQCLREKECLYNRFYLNNVS